MDIEIGVADPLETAALWAYLLDIAQLSPTSVDLGTRVTFVPATTGGIQTVTLRCVGEPAADVQRLGVTFRHTSG